MFGCGSLWSEQADWEALSWKLLMEDELASDLLSSRLSILRRRFLFSFSS